MHPDLYLRWEFDLSGHTNVRRAQSNFLTATVRPLFTAWATRPEAAYASRQGARVWLVVPTQTDRAADLRNEVGALSPAPVQVYESGTDRLLAADCRDYRAGLRTTTEIALDLLDSPQHRAHQEFLIRAACSASADVSTLQAYLLGHSARVAKLSKLDAGRGTAQREQTEPVIHDRHGRIRDSDSFGNDPDPPHDRKH